MSLKKISKIVDSLGKPVDPSSGTFSNYTFRHQSVGKIQEMIELLNKLIDEVLVLKADVAVLMAKHYAANSAAVAPVNKFDEGKNIPVYTKPDKPDKKSRK